MKWFHELGSLKVKFISFISISISSTIVKFRVMLIVAIFKFMQAAVSAFRCPPPADCAGALGWRTLLSRSAIVNTAQPISLTNFKP